MSRLRIAEPKPFDQVLKKHLNEMGLGARIPFRAYLLFVDENGKDRPGGFLIEVYQGGKKRVGRRPVVLAVSPDHAPVDAHVPCLEGRHYLDLGADKVFFLDMPYRSSSSPRTAFFTGSFSSPSRGMLPKRRVSFSPSIASESFFSSWMLPGKMGEQIVDGEDRVARRPRR